MWKSDDPSWKSIGKMLVVPYFQKPRWRLIHHSFTVDSPPDTHSARGARWTSKSGIQACMLRTTVLTNAMFFDKQSGPAANGSSPITVRCRDCPEWNSISTHSHSLSPAVDINWIKSQRGPSICVHMLAHRWNCSTRIHASWESLTLMYVFFCGTSLASEHINAPKPTLASVCSQRKSH